jgi:hypothetical protein
MNKEATFQQVIDMCNKVGWDKGVSELEKIVNQTENMQAYLFGGTAKEIKKAQELSQVIIAQNFTIAKLKQYKKDNNII